MRIAVIDGPLYYYSTRYWGEEEIKNEVHLYARGVRVRMFRVQIQCHYVFAAPTKSVCQDWLYRQGYFPLRSRDA